MPVSYKCENCQEITNGVWMLNGVANKLCWDCYKTAVADENVSIPSEPINWLKENN